MIDFLFAVDRAAFLFLNQTIANPLGDFLWPLITDYDKHLPVRILLLCAWLWLLIKGGRKGRTVALLLIPLLIISDKLNSEILKELFVRPRPCHVIGGVQVVPEGRLLVPCGPGNSFPSSHAVNNFAVAMLFASFYPSLRYGFFGWAALVALSRSAVGVHYPADVLGGALVGTAITWLVLGVWKWASDRYQSRRGMRSQVSEP
jgi:undecaprenyl-diphosphatase